MTVNAELLAAVCSVLTAAIGLFAIKLGGWIKQLTAKLDAIATEIAAIRDPDIAGVRDQTTKLVTMHEHADLYQFGSGDVLKKTDQIFEQLSKSELSMLELVEVVKAQQASSNALIETIRQSMVQRSRLLQTLDVENE